MGLKVDVCQIPFSFKDVIRFLSVILKIPRFDIVIFQKLTHLSLISRVLFYLCKMFNKITVYDIDDSPSVFLEKYGSHDIFDIIKRCNAVISGSESLAQTLKEYHTDVYYLPTTLEPEAFTHNNTEGKEVNDELIIGWIGIIPAHEDNLQILVEPFKMLGKVYPFTFTLLGVGRMFIKDIPAYRAKIMNIFNIDGVKVNIPTDIEWGNPQMIYKTISNFTVGVAPLIDNEVNAAKSAFKVKQYMARKVPVVASPVGENKRIIKDGQNGFLANHLYEWVEKISILINNTELRQEIGEQGYQTIAELYSPSVVSQEALKIFQLVMRNAED
jgi:glycosyltransferase involved in cell wall biosynthesis